MPKKVGKQGKGPVQLFPPAGWREDQLSRLPRKFRPHRLEEVIREAKGRSRTKSIDADVILAFRRRNEEQINELARTLGFDPTDPAIWQRAFFSLAMIHRGVGHLTSMPPRESNRRAAKWTAEQKIAFHLLMLELMAKGKKQTTALREIANDPEKWKLFPKPKNERSDALAQRARFENFRKRWTLIKKATLHRGLSDLIVGTYPVNGSETEKATWQPNLEGLPPFPLGKSN